MSPDLGLVDAARRGDRVGDADRHRERLGGVPAAGVHLRAHGSTLFFFSGTECGGADQARCAEFICARSLQFLMLHFLFK